MKLCALLLSYVRVYLNYGMLHIWIKSMYVCKTNLWDLAWIQGPTELNVHIISKQLRIRPEITHIYFLVSFDSPVKIHKISLAIFFPNLVTLSYKTSFKSLLNLKDTCTITHRDHSSWARDIVNEILIWLNLALWLKISTWVTVTLWQTYWLLMTKALWLKNLHRWTRHSDF